MNLKTLKGFGTLYETLCLMLDLLFEVKEKQMQTTTGY